MRNELIALESAIATLENLSDTARLDAKAYRVTKSRLVASEKRLRALSQFLEIAEEEIVELEIEGSDLVEPNPAAEEIKRRSRRNDA